MAPPNTKAAEAAIDPDAVLTAVAQLLGLGEARAVSDAITNPDGSVSRFVANGLEEYKTPALNPPLPDFVKQSETLNEPASFIDYLQQFGGPTRIARASLANTSIVAVLDYHGRAREGSDNAVPGRGAHQVTLNCPFDVDYAKWRKVFGKFIPQQAMVEHLEDLIHTIAEPSAAVLLEAISDIQIERQVRFKSKRNDANGNVKFSYEETDDGGSTRQGEFLLPEHVILLVPIFQGGNPVQLTAKLRIRMDKGELGIGLAVPGIENKEREAFRTIAEEVRERTQTPVFYVGGSSS